jgi:hypothetical protein
MSETIDWEIERAIIALINEFGWRADHALGSVADLFTDDATITSPAGVISGRDQISARYAPRGDRLSKHYMTNIRVTDQGGGRYLVRSYALTLNGPAPAPAASIRIGGGVLTDEVVFRQGKPLIANRKLELAFVGTVTPMTPPAR